MPSPRLSCWGRDGVQRLPIREVQAVRKVCGLCVSVMAPTIKLTLRVEREARNEGSRPTFCWALEKKNANCMVRLHR